MNAVAVTQSVISQVLADSGFGNLGFFAEGLMFLTFGLLSFVSAPQIDYLGYKGCLVLGSFTYCVYISTQMTAVLREDYPSLTGL